MFLFLTKIMKKLLLITYLFLGAFHLHAQNITGEVIDGETNEVLPFVNIALFDQDSTLVTNTTTDFDGRFLFKISEHGDYILKFLFTGYKESQRVITINDDLDISLGLIKLASNITELEGVTITAEKESINMTSSGMSFNVDNDGGADMEDIISGMPSISMDENGEVTSNGESVVILVNGEESDLENPLEEIPIQLIDRVELLNNPPAEFTSASSAINIVLKEDVQLGNHGRVLLEGGSPDQYKFNMNLSRSKDRWSTNLNVGARSRSTPYEKENKRLNYNSNYRESIRNDDVTRENYNVNWTTSYAASANDKLKLILTWNRYDYELSGVEDEHVYDVDVMSPNPRDNHRTIYNERSSQRIQAQFNYDKNFMQEGRKLLFRARWSMDSYDQLNSNAVETFYHDNDSLILGDTRITERDRPSQNYFVTLKYIHPFNERSTLTTGFRNNTRIQQTNEKFYNVNSDGVASDRGNGAQNIDYLNQRFSGYASWNYKFYNDLSFRVGSVVESSIVDNQVSSADTLFNTNNNFLVVNPSASLNKKFNENWMGNISYSFRLNTPSEWKMNPTINDSNPLYISYGNPDLGLEKFQKLTLEVTNQQDKVSTRYGLFYRNIFDGTERVFETKGDTVYATYENIVNKHTLGGNVYVHVQIGNNQSVIFSGNLYKDIYNQRIVDHLPHSQWMYNAKLTYKAKFLEHYRFRVVGYYTSERIDYSGNSLPASGVDLSLSRYVVDKKGKIWLNVQDVFQTRAYSAYSYSPTFESEYNNDYVSTVRLGFTWSFYSLK